MTILSFISIKLATETVVAQVFVVLAVLYLFFFNKKKIFIVDVIGKYAIVFAFLVALVAMSGSLFYSQIMGFAPCDLCWFQRIFMYPLVVLLGLALIKKDSNITGYALPLASIGFCISLYQNYLYYYNGGLHVFCQLAGNSVSCVKRYIFEFGYVTIPVMALTAFALIIVLLIFYKLSRLNRGSST